MRLPRVRGDDGMALLTVLLFTVLLTGILLAGAAFATTQLKQSRKGQDWNAALAAAQAGVDDYLQWLNTDRANRFCAWKASDFADTVKKPPNGNFFNGMTCPTPVANYPAAMSGWVAIPSATNGFGQDRATFRYDLDNSYYSEGLIRVRSTGRAQGQTRTIVSTIKRGGFKDYVYFTNFETKDPDAYPPGNDEGQSGWAAVNCAKPYWERPGECGEIHFATGDVLKGKVHSNDAMLMDGPRFTAEVTSAYPGEGSPVRYWRDGDGSSTPTFEKGDPTHVDEQDFPASNDDLKAVTDKTNTLVPAVGCRYTGPTRIVLNSNGTMTVTSPMTASPHPVAGCAAGSTAGVTVNVPTAGVVFVQAVPAVADIYTRPNATGLPACVSRSYTQTGQVSKPIGGKTRYDDWTVTWTVPGNRIGWPVAGDNMGDVLNWYGSADLSSGSPMSNKGYGCNAGDAFLSGTLKGRLTIGTANDITVVGDVTYSDWTVGGNDVLGLVPAQYVNIYHPMTVAANALAVTCNAWTSSSPYQCKSTEWRTSWSDDPNELLSARDVTIHAAALTVGHSFRVQNYNYGSKRGNLVVRGSLAQNFRGIVGTGGVSGTGYMKDYEYDPRLNFNAPPYFITPVTSPWAQAMFRYTDTPTYP